MRDLTDLSSSTLKQKASQIRLAFFDIDGTIYRADHSLSNRTVSALRGLRRQGIKVCLATGRPYFGSFRVIEQLEICDCSVFFSGSLVINPASDFVLYAGTFTSEELFPLVEDCRNAGLYIEFYDRDGYFIEKKTHLTTTHTQYLHKAGTLLPLEEIYRRGPFFKFVAISETPEQEVALREIVARHPNYSYGLSGAASDPHLLFMNVTRKEASREAVFDLITDYYSVEPDQVISFGDSESDLPFLLRSGMGVAVGNATPSVLERAPILVPSVEDDGVAWALEQLGMYLP